MPPDEQLNSPETIALLWEFVGVVKSMRAFQKDYFATRTKSAMSKSMTLEKEVDRRLQGLEFPQFDTFGNRRKY